MKIISKNLYQYLSGGMENPLYTKTYAVSESESIRFMIIESNRGNSYFIKQGTESYPGFLEPIFFQEDTKFEIELVCSGESSGYMIVQASKVPSS